MKIYNSATRKKEEFEPLEQGKVKLYACGPTVYNYFHIGNARAFITFDVIRRYFEYKGFEVIYAQNITDIDDNIISKANTEGISAQQVADKYINAFFTDTARLGIKHPTYQPHATQFVQEMIEAIKMMQHKGNAYEVNGDVYFSTESLPNYGNLSGKVMDDLRAGARVEENTQKRHPADFTLWKAAKPMEPFWDSPWGKGRPGWHTECVVMSRKYLGETFDIHGGGIDLLFPHHENEQAQALALTGKPLANYWMHNGFLNIEGEKMSKSLDNFFTARDILDKYDPEAIRFFFLSKHYRSPIDFNREIIEESATAVNNFYSSLKDIDYLSHTEDVPEYAEIKKVKDDFNSAMDDDFNTAKAIATLFELNRMIKDSDMDMPKRLAAARELVNLGNVLGFFQHLEQKLRSNLNDTAVKLIELMILYRNEARANRNWQLSDRIRDDLKSIGVILMDSKTDTTWKIEE